MSKEFWIWGVNLFGGIDSELTIPPTCDDSVGNWYDFTTFFLKEICYLDFQAILKWVSAVWISHAIVAPKLFNHKIFCIDFLVIEITEKSSFLVDDRFSQTEFCIFSQTVSWYLKLNWVIVSVLNVNSESWEVWYLCIAENIIAPIFCQPSPRDYLVSMVK